MSVDDAKFLRCIFTPLNIHKKLPAYLQTCDVLAYLFGDQMQLIFLLEQTHI